MSLMGPKKRECGDSCGDDGGETYVCQRYVKKPLTWRDTGRKFHFRVYALLSGDLSAYVFPKAFAHVANAPLTYNIGGRSATDSSQFCFSPAEHLTNVASNSRDPSKFLGYFISTLPEEYPKVWEATKCIASALGKAAAPFLRCQLRATDFTIIGLDILPDEDGNAWLLEANCPPCMGAQQQQQQQQRPGTTDEVDFMPVPTVSPEDGAAPLHEEYLAATLEGFVLPALRAAKRGAVRMKTAGLPSTLNSLLSATPKKERGASWHQVRAGGDAGVEYLSAGRSEGDLESANEVAWFSFQLRTMNLPNLHRKPRCAISSIDDPTSAREGDNTADGKRRRDVQCKTYDEGFLEELPEKFEGVLDKKMRVSSVVTSSVHISVPLSMHLCDGSADWDE